MTRIIVKTKIYTKDNCGLFDHGSKDFKMCEFELSENGVLAVNKEDVVLIKKEAKRKDLTNIAEFKFDQSTMTISHTSKQYTSLEGFDESKIRARRDYHERFIWKSIQPESAGEALDIYDVFRMGRLRFRVREIWDLRGQRSIGVKGIDDHIEYAEHQDQEETLCRVCMEPQNPAKEFANVCDCSKRMPIHADCLMDWVKTKMNKRTTEVYEFYTWKGLECDICKKPYPANSKKYSLLSYERPQQPYIVLDLYNKEANTLRGCFVIKRSKDNLKIGRGQDCDIRLSDISISRSHSKIFFTNGTYHVTDLKSKFGTLILIRQPFIITPNSHNSIYQIGKCVMEVTPKRVEAKCMPICGSSKPKNPNIKKNPFENIQDESDFLSETIIEEREEAERVKQLQNKPVQEHPQDNNPNVQQEDDDDIVHHHSNIEIQPNPLTHPHQNAGASNGQARPNPASPNPNRMATSGVEANRPGTSAQPSQPNQPAQRGQLADDELFNSNIFNNENNANNGDDFDFDFESSADDDNAGRQSGGPNARNFETAGVRR